MSLLSVGVENLGLSPCATLELLEQLYSKSLTPELAQFAAAKTIYNLINNPELAAEFKSLFYNLGTHFDKRLYLEAFKPTYELTPVLIPERHYKELYIEIEARNRLKIPRYHIDDSSLKQLKIDLVEVHKLITWEIDTKSYSNARRKKCYEDEIRVRYNEMKRELHIE